MMLLAGRRRGLDALRDLAVRSQQQTFSGRDAVILSRSIVSVGNNGNGNGNNTNNNSDKNASPQSPSWQQQSRIYHESPSRHQKLKVPSKKGIVRVRGKSSASASLPLYDNLPYADAIPTATTNNKRGPRSKRTAPRRHILDPSVHTRSPEFEAAVRMSDLAEQDAVAIDAERSPLSIVDAYYAAKTIDLAPLIISDFSKNAVGRKYNKDSLILQLSPSNSSTDTKNSIPSYVAVYRFGSIIFFNVGPREKAQLLECVKRHAIEPLATGFEQRDSFGVCVMPGASRTRVTPEHAVVKKLNLNAVAVISEVMAQSVALDSYNGIVDSLLENFAIVNSKISTTNQMDLDKKMLFSKIAQNNRIFIDLISKLRIKGRSQIAWDEGEYEIIHSGMTTEFDIDDRFELIQFKLDLINQNSKLFLEVIHHQKAASVEWIIVVLIGFECVLMCLDMSGQGTVMFEYAKDMLM